MLFLYIVLAIVILLLMIVIHEFGHYLAGKILKFKINEFSVGFGPKIFSKKKKNGEVFSLRLIPLGGYCAFEGEIASGEDILAPGKDKTDGGKKDALPEASPQQASDSAAAYPTAAEQTGAPVTAADAPYPTESDRVAAGAAVAEPAAGGGRSFLEEKPWKRIIVLLSGGVANLLSAIVFSLIFIWAIGFTVPTVSKVYTDADGVAFNPLEEGDVVRAVNGREIGVMNSYDDLIADVEENDSVTLTVERGGELLTVNVTKKHIVTETVNEETGEPETLDYVGFGYASLYDFEDVGLGYALKYCVPYMFKLSWLILGTFGDLVVGKIPITDLAGPAGTIALMADLAKANWRNILILLPLIASNLGIFNLLPIPALDGSKVVFTAIEWIRGKPINQKVENTIHTVGIILLLAFVVVLDLWRFIAPLFG